MIEAWDGSRFGGAKGAFVYNNSLAVLRRDDLPGLPWAGKIDLPGGGRDPGESPIETLLREVCEEVGLDLLPNRLTFGVSSKNDFGKTVWFFVCPITETESQSLTLGSEGQACWMMPIPEYLASEDAIPAHQDSVRRVLG